VSFNTLEKIGLIKLYAIEKDDSVRCELRELKSPIEKNSEHQEKISSKLECCFAK